MIILHTFKAHEKKTVTVLEVPVTAEIFPLASQAISDYVKASFPLHHFFFFITGKDATDYWMNIIQRLLLSINITGDITAGYSQTNAILIEHLMHDGNLKTDL